jgi:hypothetical protein
LLAPLRLARDVLRVDLRLLHRRFGEIAGDPVVGRVDHHQQIAPVHELIVGDRQFYDPVGDFRRDGYDIGPHRAVARPRRLHVDAPQFPAEPDGRRDRDQCQQQRQDADARPPAGRQVGQARPLRGGRAGRCVFTRSQIGVGHLATNKTIDESMII